MPKKKKKLSREDWKQRRSSKAIAIGTVSDKQPRVDLSRFDDRANRHENKSKIYRISPLLQKVAEECVDLHARAIVHETSGGIKVITKPTGNRLFDSLLQTPGISIVREVGTGTIVLPWKPERIVDGYYQPKIGGVALDKGMF